MKAKILSFVLFAIFLVGFASAASWSISPTTVTFNPSTSTNQFTVSNADILPITVNVPSTITVNGVVFNVADNGAVAINPVSSHTFTVTPQTELNFDDFNFGQAYSANLVMTNAANATDTKTLSVSVQNSYCSNGKKGDLDLDVTLTNQGTLGDDENWYPADTIEAEIVVTNNDNEKINDIVVRYGIYNKNTGAFLIDEDEKSFDLKSDGEKILTVLFTIDPNDMNSDDDADDFVFFVKASSDDLGEALQCNYYTEDSNIAIDEDFVVVSDITLPETVQCGETATVNFKTWNIGSNDEDDVQVVISSPNLAGFKPQTISAGDIGSFESKRKSFEYTVPANATEKTYSFEFKVLDEDGDVFENDNDQTSVISKTFNVQGNCEVKKSVLISAALDQATDAYAGEEATIKATLTNNGAGETTYQIMAKNYDSWAVLKSIEPRSITLKAGESRDVSIVLLPNKNVKGDSEFTIQAIYGTLVTDQKIVVNIKPAKSIFSSFTNFSFSGVTDGNWFIWAVAGLNIILVVLIVVIAIRIAKK